MPALGQPSVTSRAVAVKNGRKATALWAQSVVDGSEHASRLAQLATLKISSSRVFTKCVRIEVWRGGFRSDISVSTPFVCLSRSTVTPFAHPDHRTGRVAAPIRVEAPDGTSWTRAMRASRTKIYGVQRVP
jgi:hypothetical protein